MWLRKWEPEGDDSNQDLPSRTVDESKGSRHPHIDAAASDDDRTLEYLPRDTEVIWPLDLAARGYEAEQETGSFATNLVILGFIVLNGHPISS
ncbi:MAG: hypothetical protein Q9161_004691 [Pseudevernia consocians]